MQIQEVAFGGQGEDADDQVDHIDQVDHVDHIDQVDHVDQIFERCSGQI